MVSIRPPTKFSRSPAELRRFAPLLGQHTAEILREAGLDDQQIASLQKDGIIKTSVQ